MTAPVPLTAVATDAASTPKEGKGWRVFAIISSVFSRIKSLFSFKKKQQPLLEHASDDAAIEVAPPQGAGRDEVVPQTHASGNQGDEKQTECVDKV